MSNGAQNCAAEICCRPGSPQQREALIKEIAHDRPDWSAQQCADTADYLNEHWDLAKKGTLRPLKEWIAELARDVAAH